MITASLPHQLFSILRNENFKNWSIKHEKIKSFSVNNSLLFLSSFSSWTMKKSIFFPIWYKVHRHVKLKKKQYTYIFSANKIPSTFYYYLWNHESMKGVVHKWRPIFKWEGVRHCVYGNCYRWKEGVGLKISIFLRDVIYESKWEAE